MPNCEKCAAVRVFIQQQRDNPPVMSFEVEHPFRDVLDGIQAILDRKMLLDLAAQRAIRTGHCKDLKKYMELRRNQ